MKYTLLLLVTIVLCFTETQAFYNTCHKPMQCLSRFVGDALRVYHNPSTTVADIVNICSNLSAALDCRDRLDPVQCVLTNDWVEMMLMISKACTIEKQTLLRAIQGPCFWNDTLFDEMVHQTNRHCNIPNEIFRNNCTIDTHGFQDNLVSCYLIRARQFCGDTMADTLTGLYQYLIHLRITATYAHIKDSRRCLMRRRQL